VPCQFVDVLGGGSSRIAFQRVSGGASTAVAPSLSAPRDLGKREIYPSSSLRELKRFKRDVRTFIAARLDGEWGAFYAGCEAATWLW
jgi:hypothetical protein